MSATAEVGRLLVRLMGDPSNLTSALDQAAKKAMLTGAKISAAITAPLAVIGTVSLNEFGKFNQAMTESTSIMNVTDGQMRRMEQTALELAGNSAKAPEELARSYFFLASAGLDAEQSMAALPLLTSFATAGAFDMATATDLLTDAQSALGLVMDDAGSNMLEMTRLSDVLVKANILANAKVEQFSTSLTSKAGAALRSVNKDMEEGVAVLGVYANSGVKAELAGNSLARLLLLLRESANKNKDAFKKYNFEVFDSQGKMRNMADIVENLENVLGGMSDQQKSATLTALGFRAQVQGSILPLLGSSATIREYEAALRDAGGTTEDVANKQLKSFNNQLAIVRNRVAIVAISIGEYLAPYVMKLNELISAATSVWGSWSESTKKTIVAVGIVVAMVGPMVLQFGIMLKVMSILGLTFTGLLGPIGLVVAAVGGILYALQWAAGGWGELLDAAKSFVMGTLGFFANFQDNVWTLLSWMQQNWYQLFVEIGQLAAMGFWGIIDVVSAVMKVMGRIIWVTMGWIGERFKSVFSVDFLIYVLDGIIAAGEAFKAFATSVWNGLVGMFSGKSFTMDDMLMQMSKDLETGAKTANLGQEIMNVIGEEMNQVKNPLDGFESKLTAPKLKLSLRDEYKDTWDFLSESAGSAWGTVKSFFDEGTSDVIDKSAELKTSFMGINNAVRAGSDEFYALLAAIEPTSPTAPGMPDTQPDASIGKPSWVGSTKDVGNKMVGYLATIAKTLEEEGNKAGFELEPANLE